MQRPVSSRRSPQDESPPTRDTPSGQVASPVDASISEHRSATVAGTAVAPVAGMSAHASSLVLRGHDVWRLVTINRKVTVGVCIVGVFLLIALLGPLVLRQNPNAFSSDTLSPPSAQHWLGTTQTGQDVFTQVIDGARISIFVGLIAGFLCTLVSVAMGLTAGYAGGVVDNVLSLLINIFLVLPGLPLAIVLADYSPVKGPLPIAIVLTLTSWAWGARVLRAQTLSVRQHDFVQAARASGERPLRILFAEILPNEIGLVAANFIGVVVYVILAEAGLEFLGLGDPTTISWGTMLYWAQNNNALLVGAWWWFLPPGFCIAVFGAGLTLINFGIDEIANPRLRSEPGLKRARKKGIA